MNKELDTEWVELMQIAKADGISIDEVRAFLQESSPTNKEALVVK